MKKKKNGRTVTAASAAGLGLLGLLTRGVLPSYKATAYVLLGVGVFLGLLALLWPHKVAVRVLLGCAAVGVLALAAAEIPVFRNAGGDEEADAPYLVVLGAGLNGTTPSLSLHDRLVAAEAYLTAHPDAVAIVSGGQGPDEVVAEAEVMARWLTEHGIDSARIIKEDRATSTQENLAFSFDLIRARGDDPADGVAIVSSEYHLYRAKTMAARLGATAYGVAGRTAYPTLRANYYLREAFAVWYLWVFG